MTQIERLVSMAEDELDRRGVCLDWSFPDERDKVAFKVYEWLKNQNHKVPLESVQRLYEEYAREVGV